MKKELIEELENLKEALDEVFSEHPDIKHIREITANNLVATNNILKNAKKEGKTLLESFNDTIRSYEVAYAKCLEAGAGERDNFEIDFTKQYLATLLMIVGNILCSDLADDNVAFIKSKLREALIYVDRL